MAQHIDINFLETVLKRYDQERCVNKAVLTNLAPASGQGDNYSSCVLRAKLDVVLKSGRKKTKSVIIKRLPNGQEETVKWLRRFGVFKREIEVMDIILPAMEELMAEYDDTHEIIWPQLIHYTPYSEVILEDLKVYGYAHAERQKGFNLAQAELVLENTGRFHALSVILKERGVLDPSGHIEHVLPHSKVMVKNYIQASFITLSKIILRDWDTQWEDIGKRLRQAVVKIPAYMEEFGRYDESRFNVLNHGDLWAPNIMFKYGKDKEVPISMRLIDYQMTFYTTYGFDLNHFMYSSISREVRNNHFEDLLRVYHNSLINTFKFYKFDTNKVPSFQDVLNEMERTSFFALIAVCMIMSVIMSDPKYAVDFEYVITPRKDITDLDENIFSAELYVDCLKDQLLKLSSKGVF